MVWVGLVLVVEHHDADEGVEAESGGEDADEGEAEFEDDGSEHDDPDAGGCDVGGLVLCTVDDSGDFGVEAGKEAAEAVGLSRCHNW